MSRMIRWSEVAIGLAMLAITACTSAGASDDVSREPAVAAPTDVAPALPPETRPSLPAGPIVSPDLAVSSPPRDPNGPAVSGPALPPVEPSQPPITVPPGSQLVEAPIDGLEVVARESFPVQYGLQIKAGLPSGCAKQAGYEVSRDGTQIKVRVLNAMPLGPVACTMIYGTYELNVSLGSDFTPGTTYTVQVNDKVTSFVAR